MQLRKQICEIFCNHHIIELFRSKLWSLKIKKTLELICLEFKFFVIDIRLDMIISNEIAVNSRFHDTNGQQGNATKNREIR